MSFRKRTTSFRTLNNGVPAPNIQVYQYEYIHPGCYYFPQVVTEVTPTSYAYLNHWQPCCSAATYVADCFGRVNYCSDLDYQHQMGTSILPQRREVTYNYYNDGEREISSLPQIEEDDDISEDCKVSVRKRKRLNHEYESTTLPKLKKFHKDELSGSTVYRSREGYLVEEPNETDQENL